MVCGVMIVLAVMVVVGVVVAVHQFGTPVNIAGGPILSAAPSAYGLNAVVSHNGKTMFITEPASNRVVVLDVATGAVIATVPTGPTPAGLAISPDGDEVWVVDTYLQRLTSSPPSSGLLGEVTVFSTRTSKVVGTVEVLGIGSLDVAFSPDGRRAYMTSNGSFLPGSVNVVDTATLKVVGSLQPISSQSNEWFPASVAVSPDGTQVWVSSASALTPQSPGYLYVFSASTGNELERIAVGEGSFFMALSHDGRYAYVADKESCDVREIDTATLRITATVRTSPADGCPYGLAATSTDGVIDTVTGSDNTLGLGNQGDVMEKIDFDNSTVNVVHGVGPDPVTVTEDPATGLAYVIDANTPLVTVVNTRNDKVLGTLNLAPSK